MSPFIFKRKKEMKFVYEIKMILAVSSVMHSCVCREQIPTFWYKLGKFRTQTDTHMFSYL